MMRIARDKTWSWHYLSSWNVSGYLSLDQHATHMANIKNTTIHESVAINYHIIREAVVAGIIRIREEDTHTNIANTYKIDGL